MIVGQVSFLGVLGVDQLFPKPRGVLGLIQRVVSAVVQFFAKDADLFDDLKEKYARLCNNLIAVQQSMDQRMANTLTSNDLGEQIVREAIVDTLMSDPGVTLEAPLSRVEILSRLAAVEVGRQDLKRLFPCTLRSKREVEAISLQLLTLRARISSASSLLLPISRRTSYRRLDQDIRFLEVSVLALRVYASRSVVTDRCEIRRELTTAVQRAIGDVSPSVVGRVFERVDFHRDPDGTVYASPYLEREEGTTVVDERPPSRGRVVFCGAVGEAGSDRLGVLRREGPTNARGKIQCAEKGRRASAGSVEEDVELPDVRGAWERAKEAPVPRPVLRRAAITP